MIVMHLNAVHLPETESRFSADLQLPSDEIHLPNKDTTVFIFQFCIDLNNIVILNSWWYDNHPVEVWWGDGPTVSWLMSWYISSHEHWAAHLTGHWTQQQTGQMLQLWRPAYWRLTRLFVLLLHSVSCVRGFKTRGVEGGEDAQKGERAHFFLTCSGGMEVPCNKIWM